MSQEQQAKSSETKEHWTDDNRTKLVEDFARYDPMEGRREGLEGLEPVTDSSTFLTEKEIADLDMSAETLLALNWLTKPARLRDVQTDIDHANIKMIHAKTIRRSRDGSYLKYGMGPAIRSTTETTASQRELEKKKKRFGLI